MLAMLASLALAAPLPKDFKPVYYYPTTVGAKAVYADRGMETIEIVTHVEVAGDVMIVTVDAYVQGSKDPRTMKVEVSDRGIYQIQEGDQKLDPPICWLKMPADEGVEWKREGRMGFSQKMRIGPMKEIEVPAGKFRAIPVLINHDSGPGGLRYSWTRWFAADVGVIKDGEQKELKSFTPGK